jgi:hypothetical protein
MQHIRISTAAIALALAPSSALACSLMVRMDIWFFHLQTAVMALLLAIVWVGGKRVWIGQFGFALLSGAAAHVYTTYGRHFAKDVHPPQAEGTPIGERILVNGCGGEMYTNTPGILATWFLLTLGLYCACEPLFQRFAPTLSDRPLAHTLKWIAATVVIGFYGFLVFILAAQLFMAWLSGGIF